MSYNVAQWVLNKGSEVMQVTVSYDYFNEESNEQD